MLNSNELISTLPHLPGVYRMNNEAHEVIYVGKALDLKKRVASYFQHKTGLSPRIQLMVSQVTSIDITVTRSESEALLLENNLIKSLAPRYNIIFRDDKSYPYLVLSKHRFPRLGFHRGATDKTQYYYGPFPNAGAVRESIQLLQKVFRIRTCEDTVFNNRSRACLLFQIKRCTAPCINEVDEATYKEDIANAQLFLEGKEDVVLQKLIHKMEQSAAQQNYEEAAIYRDQVKSLQRIQEKQFVAAGGEQDADVIACVGENGLLCVNLVMIRSGMHLGDKSFFPSNAEDYDEIQVLQAFLSQHYLSRSVPPLIIVNQKVSIDTLAALLSQQAGHKVQVVCNPIGQRRAWIDMALQNARIALRQRLVQYATQEARLIGLQKALDLPEPIQRIECFDVSHMMGEATVASCVVYDETRMQNGQYRHYNINNTSIGDDYAAMREVLTRRYRKLAAGEGKMPDLILIDGGRGQVNIAQEVLIELGLVDIPLVGVAKGEERKPGLEQLVFPNRPPIQLSADDPGLHLVQQIRDEAHRFAIQGHRGKRNKARTTSTLEAISGIGAKRRQRLLARFGGLKGVVAASVEDLAQVEGISRELAKKIYQELH